MSTKIAQGYRLLIEPEPEKAPKPKARPKKAPEPEPAPEGALAWEFGVLDVAPDGRLDVVWYDSADEHDPGRTRVVTASSDDRGETWSVPMVVAAEFDSHVGWPAERHRLGDYIHLRSDTLGADLVFAATFNGEQDVYFGRKTLGTTVVDETHLASLKALEVYDEVSSEFEQITGRANPAVECYRTEDAEFVFVMMGAFATKARQAVDQLREAGWPIGLVRPRLFRPFPEEKIREALKGKQGIAVIDQNISFGRGGVLHTEIASSILGRPGMPTILVSFIGGLGGRDISAEEFYQMAEITKQAVANGIAPEPRLLYTETELREVRKLQAIAHAERDQLRTES